MNRRKPHSLNEVDQASQNRTDCGYALGRLRTCDHWDARMIARHPSEKFSQPILGVALSFTLLHAYDERALGVYTEVAYNTRNENNNLSERNTGSGEQRYTCWRIDSKVASCFLLYQRYGPCCKQAMLLCSSKFS